MRNYLTRYGSITLGLAGLMAPLQASARTFAEIVNGPIVGWGDRIITILYGLAFVFFLFGIVRYIFAGGEETRAKGKQHLMWGLFGLVMLFIVWGFVRILLNVLTDWSA